MKNITLRQRIMSLAYKQKIVVFMLILLPSVTFAKNTNNLKKLGSYGMDVPIAEHKKTDNSRIYLKEGAIWASRDITRFDPVLNLSVSDEVDVQNGTLIDPLSFSLDTNFSYYITRW